MHPLGADRGINVGYSSVTDTTWLAGGGGNQQSLVSFDVASRAFIDHGQAALSTGTHAQAQSYSQLDEYLYYVDEGADTLLCFNLGTGSPDTGFATALAGGAQAYYDPHMCIVATASGAGKLYVVGGVYLRATFVFDVGSSSWSASSDLQVARAYAGCAGKGDETELFVVGGYD